MARTLPHGQRRVLAEARVVVRAPAAPEGAATRTLLNARMRALRAQSDSLIGGGEIAGTPVEQINSLHRTAIGGKGNFSTTLTGVPLFPGRAQRA